MATLTKSQTKSLNESIAEANKAVAKLAEQRGVTLPTLTPVKSGTSYDPKASVKSSGGSSKTPYLSGASSGLTPEQRENERIAEEARFGVSIPEQQPIEPTVVTDANVRETYKPKLDERINKLSETGQYFDGAGNKRNSDGTIVDERTEDRQVSYLEQGADDDDNEMFRVLDQMRKQTDADTARQVSAIEAQYNVRRQQVAEANRRAEQATSTALLLGGSSRYTTSGDDILAAEVRGGIMELAQIDAMEQGAIAEIKNAQAEKNYRLASQKLEILESRRKEKLEKATQIAERIAKENEIMRQNMIRSSREQAVAGLFMQGTNDPMTIQAMLAFDESGMPTGSDITLEEITKTLAIINPPEDMTGLSADYRTYKAMQERGEIPADWSLFDYQRAVKNATTKATGGGGSDGDNGDTDITPEDRRTLIGAGFTQDEINDVPKAVRDFGIDAVLEELPPRKRTALQKVYNAQDMLTTEKVNQMVTNKAAKEALESIYTRDELIDLVKEHGFAGLFKSRDTEVEEFLNSDKARELYVEQLLQQYRDAGMLME